MDKFTITGGVALKGEIPTSGSKIPRCPRSPPRCLPKIP